MLVNDLGVSFLTLQKRIWTKMHNPAIMIINFKVRTSGIMIDTNNPFMYITETNKQQTGIEET